MNAYRGFFNSVVRTIVPAIVGWTMAWLATTGLPVDENFAGNLTAVLGVTFNALYYIVVRFLETKFSSKWGWLLGLATSPTYVNPITIDAVEKHTDEFFKNSAKG